VRGADWTAPLQSALRPGTTPVRVPWVQAPVAALDWSLPPDQRYQALPTDAVEKGRFLLDVLKADTPGGVRYIGDLARMRTAGR